ncbi:hypothetical protein V7199_23580 [Priestia megaterium]|uniref:hypothetical protein n=1 Tax=Priestia megaterium TaxID=1404 RepID=UPI000BFAA141|nr:hypothetical protein [Priestia megaterium]PFI91813.1 hypothetical protein COI84_21055 [Priestia megaterium]PGR14212.1 hypothetical protein COC62_06375 [Priestia megaterium]
MNLTEDENTYYIMKEIKVRKAKVVQRISTDTLYERIVIPYEPVDVLDESVDTLDESTDALWEDNEPLYKSCVCELLDQIANTDDMDFLSEHENKLLLLNKYTSQPVSVDGMDPTVFTLESFNPETGLGVFSFDREMMDSESESIPVKGTFVECCDNIAGVFYVEDNNEQW